jgi:hypothetical protein
MITCLCRAGANRIHLAIQVEPGVNRALVELLNNGEIADKGYLVPTAGSIGPRKLPETKPGENVPLGKGQCKNLYEQRPKSAKGNHS